MQDIKPCLNSKIFAKTFFALCAANYATLLIRVYTSRRKEAHLAMFFGFGRLQNVQRKD